MYFISPKIKILGDVKAANNNQMMTSVKRKIPKSNIILTEEQEMFIKQQLSLFRTQQPKREITSDTTTTNKLPTQPTLTPNKTTNTSLHHLNIMEQST